MEIKIPLRNMQLIREIREKKIVKEKKSNIIITDTAFN